MLSWRLWQLAVQPDHSNPIIRRVSLRQKAASNPGRRSMRISRRLVAGATLLLIAILMYQPQLLILPLGIPVLVISIVGAAPLLLPLITIVFGAYLLTEVIHAIHREKHQHTYDLMCASTGGALYANWSCAIGILHRSGWYLGLRWGTLLSIRVGLLFLGGFILLTLWLLLSDYRSVGFPQLRLLLFLLLLFALYYTNLSQSLVLSLLAGLYVGSVGWTKHDSTLVGMLLYVFAQSLPFAAAVLLYVTGNRVAAGAHSLVTICFQCICLLLIIVIRELIIALLWYGLKHRLNSSRAEAGQPDLAAVPGVT